MYSLHGARFSLQSARLKFDSFGWFFFGQNWIVTFLMISFWSRWIFWICLCFDLALQTGEQCPRLFWDRGEASQSCTAGASLEMTTPTLRGLINVNCKECWWHSQTKLLMIYWLCFNLRSLKGLGFWWPWIIEALCKSHFLVETPSWYNNMYVCIYTQCRYDTAAWKHITHFLFYHPTAMFRVCDCCKSLGKIQRLLICILHL